MVCCCVECPALLRSSSAAVRLRIVLSSCAKYIQIIASIGAIAVQASWEAGTRLHIKQALADTILNVAANSGDAAECPV